MLAWRPSQQGPGLQGCIRKGDRILQLAFGSGFKCAAAYWVAQRNVQDSHPVWACMETFPTQPEAKKFDNSNLTLVHVQAEPGSPPKAQACQIELAI